MLTIRNLSIQLNRLHLLRNVSLSVKNNQILGIVGESGGGKSLILLALVGIIPNTATVQGTMQWNTTRLPIRQRVGSRIRWIGQHRNILIPSHPIQRQRRMWQRIHAVTNDVAECERSQWHLDPDIEAYYPHQLSGGMARRVAMWLGCLGTTEHANHLILLDEPTHGLDDASADGVIAGIAQLRMAQIVLLVSHDMDRVALLADTVAVLKGGMIVDRLDAPISYGSGSPYAQALFQAMPKHGMHVAPRDVDGKRQQPTP